MDKHTPGPCKCQSARGGADIAFCPLHAAAPALLEALEEMVDQHDYDVQCAHRSPTIMCACRQCDKARAAIRAAKGGDNG